MFQLTSPQQRRTIGDSNLLAGKPEGEERSQESTPEFRCDQSSHLTVQDPETTSDHSGFLSHTGGLSEHSVNLLFCAQV
jgi:hypothetical protein